MIILHLLSISCILFDNKEFSNFLDEKLSKDNLASKEETEKMGLDKLIDNINTAESIKSMTSSDLAPKQGEEKTQPGGKQGDTKKQTGGEKKDQAGGEKKDQAGGEKKGQSGGEKKDQAGEDKNVTVQPIKVKDKDAVLVKSEEGGNSPSIIVIADQELMKNEEELKKLPSEISGHEENTQEGEQKSKSGGKEGEQKSKSGGKEGEQKPQAGGKGGEQKPQAGGKGGEQKPQAGGKGGEQKPQAGGKGGEQKPQAGGKGGEQKPQAGGKGSPLLSLSSEESTQEGLSLKDKLNTSLFESSKDSESYVTVLYKNKPRSVKIGVKTFTIIESLKPEEKAKSATEEVSDKTLQSTQKISKEADKKKEDEKKQDEKKNKEDEKKQEKKKKEKVEEVKKKEDDKKKEEEVKKNDKKKEEEAKKNEKKQDKDKKKKEDKDKNSETEKKVEEAKKKVEETKNKKSGDETKNKKSGDETKKEGNVEKAIEKSKDEIKKDAEKNKNEIKKGLNENKEEIKKDSKQNKEEIKKELEKKSTKPENDEKKTSKDPKDIKYETPDFESNKKAESEGIWSSIFNASNDTKRLNNEKSKAKSKDNSESKKALESVVFDGDGKDLKSIKQKNSENASTEQNSASIDDLLYVIKNMPGKVNINKEGKKIYIEGDFKTPDSKDKKNNEFKFSGVIKSKASN